MHFYFIISFFFINANNALMKCVGVAAHGKGHIALIPKAAGHAAIRVGRIILHYSCLQLMSLTGRM